MERYAVSLATAYYQREGWEVEDVGTRQPFDLLLRDPGGGPDRHVEVKGSSQEAADVELTIGEVKHSREPVPCDLFLVDCIKYAPDGTGGYTTWGGRQECWPDWLADDAALQATRFRYTLPTRS